MSIVYLLFTTLVICMLRNSANVSSKLILNLSQVFYIMFSTELFARYKMVNLSDLVGFALTLTARYKKESNWESRVEAHF